MIYIAVINNSGHLLGGSMCWSVAGEMFICMHLKWTHISFSGVSLCQHTAIGAGRRSAGRRMPYVSRCNGDADVKI